MFSASVTLLGWVLHGVVALAALSVFGLQFLPDNTEEWGENFEGLVGVLVLLAIYEGMLVSSFVLLGELHLVGRLNMLLLLVAIVVGAYKGLVRVPPAIRKRSGRRLMFAAVLGIGLPIIAISQGAVFTPAAPVAIEGSAVEESGRRAAADEPELSEQQEAEPPEPLERAAPPEAQAVESDRSLTQSRSHDLWIEASTDHETWIRTETTPWRVLPTTVTVDLGSSVLMLRSEVDGRTVEWDEAVYVDPGLEVISVSVQQPRNVGAGSASFGLPLSLDVRAEAADQILIGDTLLGSGASTLVFSPSQVPIRPAHSGDQSTHRDAPVTLVIDDEGRIVANEGYDVALVATVTPQVLVLNRSRISVALNGRTIDRGEWWVPSSASRLTLELPSATIARRTLLGSQNDRAHVVIIPERIESMRTTGFAPLPDDEDWTSTAGRSVRETCEGEVLANLGHGLISGVAIEGGFFSGTGQTSFVEGIGRATRTGTVRVTSQVRDDVLLDFTCLYDVTADNAVALLFSPSPESDTSDLAFAFSADAVGQALAPQTLTTSLDKATASRMMSSQPTLESDPPRDDLRTTTSSLSSPVSTLHLELRGETAAADVYVNVNGRHGTSLIRVAEGVPIDATVFHSPFQDITPSAVRVEFTSPQLLPTRTVTIATHPETARINAGTSEEELQQYGNGPVELEVRVDKPVFYEVEGIDVDGVTYTGATGRVQPNQHAEDVQVVLEPPPKTIQFTIQSQPIEARISAGYTFSDKTEPMRVLGSGSATLEVPEGAEITYSVVPPDNDRFMPYRGTATAPSTDATHPVYLNAVAPPTPQAESAAAERNSPRPPRFDSPTGRPTPTPGQQVTASPTYVVNFLANELELTDVSCPVQVMDHMICGLTPDNRSLVQSIVQEVFNIYLQPAQRTLGWRIDGRSGATIAGFERPEGTYAISIVDGVVSLGFVGP